ncbi:MAG TPA: molecular chaperone HtpG [Clostridiales bacterium]|nr:molecular chaperone HtpG [Clostridiales bacterium]
MSKKQFKAESKKLLNLMINSIYTHKEIFLRELISNASDAIDKLYFRSLTDSKVGLGKDDFEIKIHLDQENRVLTVTDNGCGMSGDELENNLGVIAKSGSMSFKEENEAASEIDIIGQFGVGFYSAFMVSDRVTVETKAYGEDTAYRWESQGADGYTVEPCDKGETGTVITLYIKEDTEEEKYSEFLDSFHIENLVKKYSDYIRYPIRMDVTRERPLEGAENGETETVIETKTLNSMIPLWRKNKSELTKEEYQQFYQEKFYDYTEPLKIIHSKTEGLLTYDALLYIPGRAPYDFYTKDYEKGLQLYASGVLIMEKCADLLPDYYSFVRGLVDSADLSLNISREMLQHDHQLKAIAKALDKKITNELKAMLKNDRENYEKFFQIFGVQLKFGVYDEFGVHKEELKDLLLFYSSTEKKAVTIKEYRERMKEGQEKIYYACGSSVDKIDLLPQTDAAKAKGYEILYLTDNIDEFVLQILLEYDGKGFVNVAADDTGLDSEEQKEALKNENEAAKELLDFMHEAIGDAVKGVRFTNKLQKHAVCLTSEGKISLEMERVLKSMPTDSGVKADVFLDINTAHPVAGKLKQLYATDQEQVAEYAKILYAQARLIGGMSVDNPVELTDLICKLMA